MNASYRPAFYSTMTDLMDSEIPTSVRQWYDRHTRSWVTELLNAEGYSLDSRYDGTRADAAASKMSFERAIGAERTPR